MAADNSRLDELRRRVQQDPASIAFAQLAEEYRRNGDHDEAVRVCRAGLEHHPTYLSARVTLGRALMALGRTDEAAAEFESVLQTAPDNLLARRSLAELGERGDPVREPDASSAVADRTREAPRQPGDEPPGLETPPSEVPPPPEVASAGAAAPSAEAPLAVAPSAPAATTEVQVAAAPDNAPEPVDPLLQEMEEWLAAIQADRAARQPPTQ